MWPPTSYFICRLAFNVQVNAQNAVCTSDIRIFISDISVFRYTLIVLTLSAPLHALSLSLVSLVSLSCVFCCPDTFHSIQLSLFMQNAINLLKLFVCSNGFCGHHRECVFASSLSYSFSWRSVLFRLFCSDPNAFTHFCDHQKAANEEEPLRLFKHHQQCVNSVLYIQRSKIQFSNFTDTYIISTHNKSADLQQRLSGHHTVRVTNS